MFRCITLSLFISYLFVQAPAYSVATSAPKSSKYQAQQFKRKIDKLVDLHAGKANVGIEVISLRNGRRLYQKNADNLFVPSSCLKLFTAASALETLGANYQFSTALWTDGEIKGKKLVGNLYLKGSGDPELQAKDLEALAFELKLAGIEEITGALYVDNTDFDGVSQGPGWMWDNGSEYSNSPMDALTVNHSCLQLWICPGDSCSTPAKVFVYPKTSFVNVENLSNTIETKDSNIAVVRRDVQNRNLIQIKGAIAQSSEPISCEVSLNQPHLYTGHVFLEFLAKQKIACEGGLAEKAVPANVMRLAEHKSRPLKLIIQKMMKESDNLYADCLFKKTGQLRFNTVGTWSNASQAVREFLSQKMGMNTSEIVILDGSGLSRYNLVSPRQFVEFLSEAKSGAHSSDLLATFPVSGIDGALKSFIFDERLVSKIRAKTGMMKGVRTCAGYVSTKDGEELAFSIMLNGCVDSKSEDCQLENEICKYLANYSRD